MITHDSYSSKLHEAGNELAGQVKSYVKDPNPNEVHDLRTATRKMLVTLRLLPKKLREASESKKTISNYEKLLDLNTRVRHLDIILSKLTTGGHDKEIERLVKSLTKSRDASVKQALSLGLSIEKMGTPTVKVGDVPDSTLQKRFNKATRKLASRIETRLKTVVKDPEERKELHRLRQDARRLRYLLELSPEESKTLKTLTSWQEILAGVHDDDVVIKQFQKEKQSKPVKTLLHESLADRSKKFGEFVSMVGAKPTFKLQG